MTPTTTDRHRRRFPVTPGVIGAIGRQTLRQCLRRKVLLVLVLFVAVVLVGQRLIPTHDPVKHLATLIVLALWAMSFFGIIVAVFLSATALPEDRTEGTITTVMTKPVGRLNYLLGRILGFAMTSGIILLVMGVVGWGVIRSVGRWAARQTGRDDLLVAKRGIDPTEVMLREGTLPEKRLAPDAEAAVLRGSAEQVLVFHFHRGLGRLSQDGQTFEMTPYVSTGAKLPNVPGEVVVRNPLTAEERRFDRTLDSGRTLTISFPRSLIDPKAGVEVTVRRLQPGAYVRVTKGEFQLMCPSVSFEYAYLKSLVLIYFSFLLVVVVSVTASTFLSAWVAVLLAFVAYFFSVFHQMLRDRMQGLTGEAVGWLGTEAFRHVHRHGAAVEDVGDPWYVTTVNRVWYGVLWVLTHVFPDFDRFKAVSFLTGSRDVPVGVVATAALVLLAYGTCYLILGHVIFWRKELVP